MNKSFYAIWGTYFGYPSCCVSEMLHYSNQGLPYGHTVGKRKLNGTGFIPCTKCNKLQEKQLLSKISKSRICPKPFPKESSVCEDIQEIVNHQGFTIRQKKLIVAKYKNYSQ